MYSNEKLSRLQIYQTLNILYFTLQLAAVLFHKIDYLADVAECHSHNGVSSSVVHGNLVAVVECCAREHHIGHVTGKFIR